MSRHQPEADRARPRFALSKQPFQPAPKEISPEIKAHIQEVLPMKRLICLSAIAMHAPHEKLTTAEYLTILHSLPSEELERRAEQIFDELRGNIDLERAKKNLLVLGPPASGKTTLVFDLLRSLATAGKRSICVNANEIQTAKRYFVRDFDEDLPEPKSEEAFVSQILERIASSVDMERRVELLNTEYRLMSSSSIINRLVITGVRFGLFRNDIDSLYQLAELQLLSPFSPLGGMIFIDAPQYECDERAYRAAEKAARADGLVDLGPSVFRGRIKDMREWKKREAALPLIPDYRFYMVVLMKRMRRIAKEKWGITISLFYHMNAEVMDCDRLRVKPGLFAGLEYFESAGEVVQRLLGRGQNGSRDASDAVKRILATALEPHGPKAWTEQERYFERYYGDNDD